MFVFGNLLIGVARVLDMALSLYLIILVLRAILSWVGGGDARNPIVAFLLMATEPPRRAIQRLLPVKLRYFPLDIAFLVLLALVVFAQYGVVSSLLDYGTVLRRQGLP